MAKIFATGDSLRLSLISETLSVLFEGAALVNRSQLEPPGILFKGGFMGNNKVEGMTATITGGSRGLGRNTAVNGQRIEVSGGMAL
jgi:hypothetical protein